MSEHIGDFFEGMPLLKHAGGKTMAEGMSALAVDIDAGGVNVAFHNSRNGV